jgi:hypothetical protein
LRIEGGQNLKKPEIESWRGQGTRTLQNLIFEHTPAVEEC